MPRPAIVARSLGVALAATALLVAESPAALAQSPAAPTQEPARPVKPSADEDASRDSGGELPSPVLKPLSLFDNRLSNSPQTWLPGAEVKCFGCRGFETTGWRPEATNATAPWVLEGKWRRQTALGTVSAGFVGVRNYALPLHNAVAIGGDVDPAALRSAGTSAFAPVSQWSLTASVDKTLLKNANGASLGVIADVLLPVATNSLDVGHPGMGGLAATTFRFGFRIRW